MITALLIAIGTMNIGHSLQIGVIKIYALLLSLLHGESVHLSYLTFKNKLTLS